jgi:hypothetical protein
MYELLMNWCGITLGTWILIKAEVYVFIVDKLTEW